VFVRSLLGREERAPARAFGVPIVDLPEASVLPEPDPKPGLCHCESGRAAAVPGDAAEGSGALVDLIELMPCAAEFVTGRSAVRRSRA
jgi:hypothetical protein